MKLSELLEHVELRGGRPPDREITGVSHDSRRVRPGHVFVAVPGQEHEGADFIPEAVARGAVAVVGSGEEPGECGVPYVRVDDARRALAALARACFEGPSANLELVGITGTNGKTTTAFMVRTILRAAGQKTGLIGTVRYEIGEHRMPASRTTPEATELQGLLRRMVDHGCTSAVLEVSSHALAQDRVWGIEFDAAVFTNLSSEHLDYHGTEEEYFEVKRRLFTMLGQQRKPGCAVINADDPRADRLPAGASGRIGFGCSPGADVRGEVVDIRREGTRLRLWTPWGDGELMLPLPGRFNACNALAAIATCGALGVDPAAAVHALERMRPVPGRLEPVAGDRRVWVDYAHTDDALENVLGALREFRRGRLFVVFGCGGCRDTAKRGRMGRVAARLADGAVITTDNPRREDPAQIAAEIAKGFDSEDQYEIVLDRRDAIRRGIERLGEDDLLLIAGKGHETVQEFADTRIPFDDREVAAEYLAEKKKR
ncbi:UDP-N-acetylmuramoyl-L-alanyl-D-glutamate--2,6-diaminopimelate ligase [Kiritimatiella glycovorans]|uniref:UDP-N-acetylmuramoyl-L-alanyl-D-glutamate--2,6-diaminopimelate ligase n=1 Tax=Kiritimatiella glycovorans TaxID=1307763 RepID=A0A0G3EJN0_9BACT|nr:UDP-N-acetylmuramoyl-L-alanyl-D-glutamate--2,6-diaminopimelate ligase [Kiritimatiella glycovorans]AKJ65000.1 UDP-N-acetylmuramoyl-L-alanyl-D-glutamate--LD-lysine ligase [Kiritimatiella glycovorans]